MKTFASIGARIVRAREAPAACLPELAEWIATRPEAGIEGVRACEWHAEVDDDGSIYLILKDVPEPAFAVVPEPDGFEVLICDPEDMDTLGPFDTLAAALAGITKWLSWPSRSFMPL
jgi:hypothetical protein